MAVRIQIAKFKVGQYQWRAIFMLTLYSIVQLPPKSLDVQLYMYLFTGVINNILLCRCSQQWWYWHAPGPSGLHLAVKVQTSVHQEHRGGDGGGWVRHRHTLSWRVQVYGTVFAVEPLYSSHHWQGFILATKIWGWSAINEWAYLAHQVLRTYF